MDNNTAGVHIKSSFFPDDIRSWDVTVGSKSTGMSVKFISGLNRGPTTSFRYPSSTGPQFRRNDCWDVAAKPPMEKRRALLDKDGWQLLVSNVSHTNEKKEINFWFKILFMTVQDWTVVCTSHFFLQNGTQLLWGNHFWDTQWCKLKTNKVLL